MKTPAQQQSSITSSWAIDDLLQFSDIESSDKKEYLDLGELDWLADMGLFSDQFPQEALTAAEVPQLPIPQSSNFSLYKVNKHDILLKKPRIETPEDDDEFFTVPDLG